MLHTAATMVIGVGSWSRQICHLFSNSSTLHSSGNPGSKQKLHRWSGNPHDCQPKGTWETQAQKGWDCPEQCGQIFVFADIGPLEIEPLHSKGVPSLGKSCILGERALDYILSQVLLGYPPPAQKKKIPRDCTHTLYLAVLSLVKYVPMCGAKPQARIVLTLLAAWRPVKIFFNSTQMRSPDMCARPAPFSFMATRVSCSCASGSSAILP